MVEKGPSILHHGSQPVFALVFRMLMATIAGRCLRAVSTNGRRCRRVHRCFKKLHCNLKSMLSFSLSNLKPINQLVTTTVLQLKSPIPDITSL
jgi:hypothetical protein